MVRINGVGGDVVHARRCARLQLDRHPQEPVLLRRPLRAPRRREEPDAGSTAVGCAGAKAGARSIPACRPTDGACVFTTNHRGTHDLMIADVVPSPDRPGRARGRQPARLVPERPFDQAYTPRWSPDDRHVAYSSWQRGGYRDIRIVDSRRRLVRRRDARSRDRRRPGRTPPTGVAVLPLGSHRRLERVRLRARDGTPAAGHQRGQRRLSTGAVARRQVARVRGLHARGLRHLRDAARPSRAGSIRCPTRRRRPAPPAEPPPVESQDRRLQSAGAR